MRSVAVACAVAATALAAVFVLLLRPDPRHRATVTAGETAEPRLWVWAKRAADRVQGLAVLCGVPGALWLAWRKATREHVVPLDAVVIAVALCALMGVAAALAHTARRHVPRGRPWVRRTALAAAAALTAGAVTAAAASREAPCDVAHPYAEPSAAALDLPPSALHRAAPGIGPGAPLPVPGRTPRPSHDKAVGAVVVGGCLVPPGGGF